MHLLFYSHNILELHRLSTAVSLAVVIGGAYGAVRLVVDVIRFFARGRFLRLLDSGSQTPDE